MHIILYDTNEKDYLITIIERLELNHSEKEFIEIEVTEKKDAKRIQNLIDTFLNAKDVVFDSWINEVEEYEEEFINPYEEYGLKESDFI